MIRRRTVEWYSEQVRALISSKASKKQILRRAVALLKDKRLKGLDAAARRRLLTSQPVSADDVPLRQQYQAAVKAFAESPRGKLIVYLKGLPLVQLFDLSYQNTEVRAWVKERLEHIDRMAKSDEETNARIHVLISNNKHLPYPLPDLPFRFRSENGRIRMDLLIEKIKSLREAIKKKGGSYSYLDKWRDLLLANDPPELTRKAAVVKELLSLSNLGGGKKSYNDICDDLTEELCKRLKRDRKPTAATVVFLMEIGGFSKEKAEGVCLKIIAYIEAGHRVDWEIFKRDRISYLLKEYKRNH